jgi:hypothetical protein
MSLTTEGGIGPRCNATSWKNGKPGVAEVTARDYEKRYGPGGYNRCYKENEGHEIHQDEWGNRWVMDGERFRQVGRVTPTVRCPYPDCPVSGTDDEVDEHRSTAHRDEAQAGSNLRG